MTLDFYKAARSCSNAGRLGKHSREKVCDPTDAVRQTVRSCTPGPGLQEHAGGVKEEMHIARVQMRSSVHCLHPGCCRSCPCQHVFCKARCFNWCFNTSQDRVGSVGKLSASAFPRVNCSLLPRGEHEFQLISHLTSSLLTFFCCHQTGLYEEHQAWKKAGILLQSTDILRPCVGKSVSRDGRCQPPYFSPSCVF